MRTAIDWWQVLSLADAKAEVRSLSGRTDTGGSVPEAAETGTILSLDGSRLQLRMKRPPAVGTLVEVSSNRQICLGEVRSSANDEVVVEVEHELDRTALEAIQKVWRQPTR